MTTSNRIKDFLRGITRDGGILHTEESQYIVFDTRLEKSEKKEDLYYLALLTLSRQYNSVFDPQSMLLELHHIEFDHEKNMILLERHQAPTYDTLSGIIQWQDQKRFDTWMKTIRSSNEWIDKVSQLRQKLLKTIREKEN